jgi:hypothetical protein
MQISSTTIVLFLAAVASAACAGRTPVSGISRQQMIEVAGPSRFGSSSETLTAAELLTSKVTSTPEGVRRLRPEFLRLVLLPTPDGRIAHTYPSVYLNGVYAGGVEALETIPLSVVEEIRFVRAPQAKDWWGSYCECNAGVIAVRTKKNH